MGGEGKNKKTINRHIDKFLHFYELWKWRTFLPVELVCLVYTFFISFVNASWMGMDEWWFCLFTILALLIAFIALLYHCYRYSTYILDFVWNALLYVYGKFVDDLFSTYLYYRFAAILPSINLVLYLA